MAYKFQAEVFAVVLFFTGLTLPLPAMADEAGKLAVGAMANFSVAKQPTPAPPVRFIDGEGRELKLEDFRGKLVLLNFWATWCAPCRREMPSLDRLQAEFGGENFHLIALSSDRQGLPAIEKFYAELGLENLAMYSDKTSRVQRAFSVYGLPTTLILDPEGNELGRLVGPAEWDGPETKALIAHYLSRFAK